MNNQELLNKARGIGFSVSGSGFCTAMDGQEAVLLSKEGIDLLERLENEVTTVHPVEGEYRFHHYVLRA